MHERKQAEEGKHLNIPHQRLQDPVVEGAFNLEDLSENFVVEGVKSVDLGRSVNL